MRIPVWSYGHGFGGSFRSYEFLFAAQPLYLLPEGGIGDREIPLQAVERHTNAILRKGELIALEWTDVDLDAETLSVSKAAWFHNNDVAIKSPKSKSGHRTVPVPKKTNFDTPMPPCSTMGGAEARPVGDAARRKPREAGSLGGTRSPNDHAER